MPPSSERRCGTCEWWNATYTDSLLGSMGPRQCRRRSPMLRSITITLVGSNEGHGPDPAWPLTHADSWCGEWAAREESPDAT